MSETKIPSHVKPFALTNVTTATAYHFRAGVHGEWAICTVNDSTCELTVQSDWGNWSYRWGGGKSGFGSVGKGDDERARTLTEFIADRTAADYLADKLWGGGYGGRVFDAEETVKAFRKMLCERRLEEGRDHLERGLSHDGGPPKDAREKPYWHGILNDKEPLTAGIARNIWDALGGEIQDCRNGDHFIEKMFQIQGYLWISEEPWEHLATVRDHKYEVLLFGILPALIAECTKRTEHTDPPDVPVACGAV